MSKEAVQLSLPGFEQAHGRWRAEYGRQIGTDRAISNRSRIEIKPLYTPRDWNGERFLDDLGFPGQYPLHPRHLSDHAPRPHLDAAAVDRPGHARGLQQARAHHSRCRRHRDQPPAVQFRLSRRRLRRSRSGPARHLRHRDQHHRSHGPRARRRAARPHLHRDERSLAVHAARLHARRRQTARHSLDVDHRHVEPERLHLAFHRQSHVLPAVAARRAARAARPYRVLPHACAGLESGVGRRPAHAAGRRDAGRDHGLHHLDRAAICARLHRARHGHRSSCCGASLSSSTFRSASSRRSPNSAPAGASGRGWRANGSAPRTRARGASNSTARPPASISPSSSRSTISRASPCRRWPAS